VALIGADGHGRWHRRTLAPLHAAGVLDLVAVCDLAPVRDEPDAPLPAGVPVFTDHRELLAAARPDVVVICTPPHTHLEIATAAARAGADLLLEKPPVTSLAEHAALTSALAGAGRVCQVGFQALGSAALAELLAAIHDGRLGRITGVGAVGSWQRPDAYYERAPWAGRRRVAGRPVVDGALVNPFAHAVMQCLAVSAAAATAATGPAQPARPVAMELERYRVRPIEVDDTSVLRLRFAAAPPVVVAVTLCGDEFVAGDVIVHGERGRAVLEYPTDRLWLPGEAGPRHVPGRVGLLENLLAHRAKGAPLVAPLARTAAFTAVVEAVGAAPDPEPVDPAFVTVAGAGPDRVVTVAGIAAVLRRAAERLALPGELGVSWGAGGPYRARLPEVTANELQPRTEPV
jgi:predicted dehydrogenase